MTSTTTTPGLFAHDGTRTYATRGSPTEGNATRLPKLVSNRAPTSRRRPRDFAEEDEEDEANPDEEQEQPTSIYASAPVRGTDDHHNHLANVDSTRRLLASDSARKDRGLLEIENQSWKRSILAIDVLRVQNLAGNVHAARLHVHVTVKSMKRATKTAFRAPPGARSFEFPSQRLIFGGDEHPEEFVQLDDLVQISVREKGALMGDREVAKLDFVLDDAVDESGESLLWWRLYDPHTPVPNDNNHNNSLAAVSRLKRRGRRWWGGIMKPRRGQGRKPISNVHGPSSSKGGGESLIEQRLERQTTLENENLDQEGTFSDEEDIENEDGLEEHSSHLTEPFRPVPQSERKDATRGEMNEEEEEEEDDAEDRGPELMIRIVYRNASQPDSPNDDDSSFGSEGGGEEGRVNNSHPTMQEEAGRLASRTARQGVPLSPHVRPRPTLRVHVVQAINLKVADVTGASDPFAVVTVKNASFRTDTVFQNLNPTWRRNVFEFGDGLDFILETDVITVTVWDYDVLKPPDILGCVCIPIYTVLGLPPNASMWYALHALGEQGCTAYTRPPDEGLGQIQLRIEYFAPPVMSVRDPELVRIPRRPAERYRERSVEFARYRGKVWRYRLELTVLQARKLTFPGTGGTGREGEEHRLTRGNDRRVLRTVAKQPSQDDGKGVAEVTAAAGQGPIEAGVNAASSLLLSATGVMSSNARKLLTAPLSAIETITGAAPPPPRESGGFNEPLRSASPRASPRAGGSILGLMRYGSGNNVTTNGNDHVMGRDSGLVASPGETPLSSYDTYLTSTRRINRPPAIGSDSPHDHPRRISHEGYRSQNDDDDSRRRRPLGLNARVRYEVLSSACERSQRSRVSHDSVAPSWSHETKILPTRTALASAAASAAAGTASASVPTATGSTGPTRRPPGSTSTTVAGGLSTSAAASSATTAAATGGPVLTKLLTRFDAITVAFFAEDADTPHTHVGDVNVDLSWLVDAMGFIDWEGMEYEGWFDVRGARGGGSEVVGEAQMRLVLKPATETRITKKDKIVVRLDSVVGLHSTRRETATREVDAVFVRARYGSQVKESAVTPVNLGGAAFLNDLFVFDAQMLPPYSPYVEIRVYDAAAVTPDFSSATALVRAQQQWLEEEMKSERVSGGETSKTSSFQGAAGAMFSAPALAGAVAASTALLHGSGPAAEEEYEIGSCLLDISRELGVLEEKEGGGSFFSFSGTSTSQSRLPDEEAAQAVTSSLPIRRRGVEKSLRRQRERRRAANSALGSPSVGSSASGFFSHHREIRVTSQVVRRVEYYDWPTVLGTLTLRPRYLRLATHDFKHDIRLTIRYGSYPPLVSRVYRRDVNLSFRPEEVFTFDVLNSFDELVVEVRDVVGVAGVASTLALGGKLLGVCSWTLLDVIASENLRNADGTVETAVRSPHLAKDSHLVFGAPQFLPGKQRPGSSSFRSLASSRGTLALELHYRESRLALVARNANPAVRPPPPWSIENSRKEWIRFLRNAAAGVKFVRSCFAFLTWNDEITSLAHLCGFVFLCTLDFWTARVLIIVPAAILLHLFQRYRALVDGRFIESFITRTGAGANGAGGGVPDPRASLKVAVLSAAELPSEIGSVSATLSLLHNGFFQETPIGATKWVPAEEQCASWLNVTTGARAHRETSLVTWRDEHARVQGFLRAVERRLGATDSEAVQVLVVRVLDAKLDSARKNAKVGKLMGSQYIVQLQSPAVPGEETPGILHHERGGSSVFPFHHPHGGSTISRGGGGGSFHESDGGFHINYNYEGSGAVKRLATDNIFRREIRERVTIPRSAPKEANGTWQWNQEFTFVPPPDKLYFLLSACQVVKHEIRDVWPIGGYEARLGADYGVVTRELRSVATGACVGTIRLEFDWYGVPKSSFTGINSHHHHDNDELGSFAGSSHAYLGAAPDALSPSPGSLGDAGRLGERETSRPSIGRLRMPPPVRSSTSSGTSTSASVERGQEGAEGEVVGGEAPTTTGGALAHPSLTVPGRLPFLASLLFSRSTTTAVAELTEEEGILRDVAEERRRRRRREGLGGRPHRPPPRISVATKTMQEESYLHFENWSKTVDTLVIDFWGRVGTMNHASRDSVENASSPPPHHLTQGERAFLGRATIRLTDLIINPDSLEQPRFREWVALRPRFDGTHAGTSPSCWGRALVMVQLTLPEVETRGAKDTRKKLAKTDLIGQFRALQRNAEEMYVQLHNVNNALERIKNTFNWAVHSRTQLVSLLMTGFLFLCLLVPTRFIVLFVGLWLFTEKFRPHGVLVIMAKHLISLAPTDEDIAYGVARFGFAGSGGTGIRGHANEEAQDDGATSGTRRLAQEDDEVEEGAEDEEGGEPEGAEYDRGGGTSSGAGGQYAADSFYASSGMLQQSGRQIRRVFRKVVQRPLVSAVTAAATGGGIVSPSSSNPSSGGGGALGTVAATIAGHENPLHSGYLRVLERHLRGMWFKRYYFSAIEVRHTPLVPHAAQEGDGVVAPLLPREPSSASRVVDLAYWQRKADRDDLRPPYGRLRAVVSARSVSRDSPAAEVARKHDCYVTELIFLVKHEGSGYVGTRAGSSLRASEAGLDGGTLLVAETSGSRRRWIAALSPADAAREREQQRRTRESSRRVHYDATTTTTTTRDRSTTSSPSRVEESQTSVNYHNNNTSVDLHPDEELETADEMDVSPEEEEEEEEER